MHPLNTRLIIVMMILMIMLIRIMMVMMSSNIIMGGEGSDRWHNPPMMSDNQGAGGSVKFFLKRVFKLSLRKDAQSPVLHLKVPDK